VLVRCHEGSWVVFTDGYVVHDALSTYLNRLAASRAENTVRNYAGRIARFLTWCEQEQLPWATSDVGRLGIYRRTLGDVAATTMSGHLVAITGFMRWACSMQLVDPAITATYQDATASRFRDPAGIWHARRAPELRVNRHKSEITWLQDSQVAAVLAACRNVRDRTLVQLMIETGMRIGEALGLMWHDLHLLPSTPGCRVHGAHLHVTRRVTENGAYAKSRRSRTIPIRDEMVRDLGAYQAHVVERTGRTAMVFVNLYRGKIGAGMRYASAQELFERLSAATGLNITTHICRHTAATRWVRSATDIDVVADLLGHASMESTKVYLHARDEDLRAAVERVAR
jgi:integrase